MNLRQTGRRRNIRSLIGFEIFLKTACLSFSFPLLRIMSDFCLWAAGYSYVTKENILDFMLSPCVLVCTLVLLTAVALLAVLEINAVRLAVQQGDRGRILSFSDLFLESLNETVCLFRNRRQGMKTTLCCLLFVVCINLPVVLFLGLASFGFLLTKRKRMLHGILQRAFLLYLAEIGVYLSGLFILIAVVVNSNNSVISGALLLRIFKRYHLICGILFASVNTVVLEYFCMQVWLRQKRIRNPKMAVKKERTQKDRWKGICLRFACVLVFVMTVTQTVAFFRNKSVLFSETLEELCITAHRGASATAPENTMAAVGFAIAEGADYVEIDVRLTADGIPVLLHDRALFRTTGVLKNVDQVTYEELYAYDAGKKYAVTFTGEKVPRLEEVLSEYGGRIGFNIELKGKNDRGLVSAVVELIEKYGLEESCIVTSASYEQLEGVKEENRALKTGYILSLVYGDFYENEAADFFSIRSDFVTEEIVEKAHARGKEVHAWTVNRENELKRMKAIGVDNIITDKPAYAREIVQQNYFAETLGEWIRLLTSQK